MRRILAVLALNLREKLISAAAAAAHSAEAIRAIYRLIAAWHEGYFGVFATIAAYHLGHHPLATVTAITRSLLQHGNQGIGKVRCSLSGQRTLAHRQ